MSNSYMLVQHSIATQSGYEESFGINFVEAAFSCLPVVSTYAGGIPEVINEFKTGFLVKQNDTRSMASAMELLIDYPDLALQLGLNANLRAHKLFTQSKMITSLQYLIFS